MMLLEVDQVDLLIYRATEYAHTRNLDVEQYLLGMFEPLLRDGLQLDLADLVDRLLRYHQDWLRKP